MLARSLSGSQHYPIKRILSWEYAETHRRRSSKHTSVIPKINEEQKEVIPRIRKPLVKLNIRVGGHLFQTAERTLNIFPETLLGLQSTREKYYDKQKDEYTFDRCYLSFDAILFYYQSKGILSRPAYVKRSKFLEELQFFQINRFLDVRHETETNFVNMEKIANRKPSVPNKEFIWRIICFKNNPRFRNSSYVFYVTMVILSAIVICLEPTVPPKHVWRILEFLFSIIFTFEYLIRIYIASETKRYLFSPYGILDLVSMISSQLCVTLFFTKQPVKNTSFIKFSQVFRILKYARVSRGVQELIHILWSCREYLGLFVGTALISCFIAAAIINLAELQIDRHKHTEYVTFFNWFWYSIITATGVGYGDYYPQSIAGKLCGGVLSVMGVIIFCLPATQLVYKFVELYYLPDVLGNNSEGKRKLLITAVRENFLEDMESSGN